MQQLSFKEEAFENVNELKESCAVLEKSSDQDII